MVVQFRWNDWNLEHLAKHGCDYREAESVVRRPSRGFPRKIGDGKWLVEGRGQGDRLLKVIYIFSPPGVIYVIHAMPLRIGRRHRRKRRR